MINDTLNSPAFALLNTEGKQRSRSAGVLMPISSLPSPFGIGDLGPEARKFADFLSESYQTYWQVLPINPIEKVQSYSPYSSASSHAGNTLFISPEVLVQDGLLTNEEVTLYYQPPQNETDYAAASEIKHILFSIAWQRFKQGEASYLQQAFEAFCINEKAWLDAFSLYMVIKNEQENKPWFHWPAPFKMKHTVALQKVEEEHKEELDKIKWLQFIFDRQWKEFKKYCNEKGLQLLGDLPIYVSYDSADVWSHKEIFALDENGNNIGLAGVPPDAFSADGQLWGMPVYQWEVLKKREYDWWMERLQKNKETFDIIRLDHFRAFADYWEVPAGEQTAKKGQWKKGPGAHFFTAVMEQSGALPFIAEDLGEVNEEVYQLRDEFGLPGMKVLQFAFGDDIAISIHIPHNYIQNCIVYTGTHDNNTITGWYNNEASHTTKENLNQYLGHILSEKEVSDTFIRLAYSSVAKMAIIPVQDILGLDGSARMNNPSTDKNNWRWRLLPGQLSAAAQHKLKKWVLMYNRI